MQPPGRSVEKLGDSRPTDSVSKKFLVKFLNQLRHAPQLINKNPQNRIDIEPNFSYSLSFFAYRSWRKHLGVLVLSEKNGVYPTMKTSAQVRGRVF